MAKKFMFVCVGVLALQSGLSAVCLAGANPNCKAAVHIKPHPTSCTKGYPAFTDCAQIAFTRMQLGDLDAMPVFYDLAEYTRVEFGIAWNWGDSDSWVRCRGTAASGGNFHYPGGGGYWTVISWDTCQRNWSVAPGALWLIAIQPGTILLLPNPHTGLLGVADCASTPSFDTPVRVSSAGVGGVIGDDPCGPVESQPTTWGSIKSLFD